MKTNKQGQITYLTTLVTSFAEQSDINAKNYNENMTRLETRLTEINSDVRKVGSKLDSLKADIKAWDPNILNHAWDSDDSRNG